MKYMFLAVLAAFVLTFTSACSFLARGEQIIAVTVTPSDASVIANGVEYHMLSPMFIEVPTRDALLITAYKPGTALPTTLPTANSVRLVSSMRSEAFSSCLQRGFLPTAHGDLPKAMS